MNSKEAMSKIGAGKSIRNRHERSFKRGNLMFIEGESSTEMFIIKSGLVRIFKQEGENTIELAQLGAGSVLGELSLLDHQPRSATGQVLEDTLVTVIDEELFTRTLKSIPPWLENMVHLVVKRLRDTMKKTGDDIIRKSIAGVIQVILLMMDGAAGRLYVTAVREQVLTVIGLGGLELENIFMHLVLKEFILLKKDASGKEYLVIREPAALRLYMNYLRMHQLGGMLIGESLSAGAVDLMKDILAAARKSGSIIAGKLMRIGEPQLELELDRSGKGRFIDRDALEELTGSRLVMYQDDDAVLKNVHNSRKVLLFNPDLLESVLILRKWLPIFTEEIKS